VIRVQLLLGDDAIFARTGELVPAEETLYLALGDDPDHLEVVQVDLTAENAGKCRLEVGAWVRYGHPPGEIDAPGGLYKNDGRHRRPGSKMGSQEAALHYAQMRAWADQTGFAKSNGEPGYRKMEKGGYYHSTQLRQAFAVHLKALAGLRAAG